MPTQAHTHHLLTLIMSNEVRWPSVDGQTNKVLEGAERSRDARPHSFPPPVEGDHLLSLSVRGQATGTITDHSPSAAADQTDELMTAFQELNTSISISLSSSAFAHFTAAFHKSQQFLTNISCHERCSITHVLFTCLCASVTIRHIEAC